MQRFLPVLLAFFCSLTTANVFAQTASTELSNANLTTNNSELLHLDSDDWSFYVDEESQTYFIDFETIKVNLSDIIVKNESGEVLLKEDVSDLPVNSIFEIDFSPYGTGSYEIELRSFTGSFEKDVKIK